jgi:hypothetical protein
MALKGGSGAPQNGPKWGGPAKVKKWAFFGPHWTSFFYYKNGTGVPEGAKSYKKGPVEPFFGPLV